MRDRKYDMYTAYTYMREPLSQTVNRAEVYVLTKPKRVQNQKVFILTELDSVHVRWTKQCFVANPKPGDH